MSLRVDEEILREWREQVASGFEPGATMRLAPTTPVGEALSALDAVVGEVVGSPPPLEGPSRGEWSWIRAVDDVVVTVGGTIPADDIPELKRLGVAEVFTPGASTEDIIEFIRDAVASRGAR